MDRVKYELRVIKIHNKNFNTATDCVNRSYRSKTQIRWSLPPPMIPQISIKLTLKNVDRNSGQLMKPFESRSNMVTTAFYRYKECFSDKYRIREQDRFELLKFDVFLFMRICVDPALCGWENHAKSDGSIQDELPHSRTHQFSRSEEYLEVGFQEFSEYAGWDLCTFKALL